MKTYEIRGGYNVTEQYETTVKANNKEEAEEKANKIPISNWSELQSWNETGFIIDSVDEVEDEWKL